MNYGIHEFDQVAVLVILWIVLSIVFDGIVNEVFLFLAFLLTEVETFEVTHDVFFAFILDVGLVNELKGLDHYLETVFKALVFDFLEFHRESGKDFDGSFAEILVTK